MRLDKALVVRGLAASRGEAQQRIDAGDVRVNGAPATRASAAVADGDAVTVAQRDGPAYVSRGGYKLSAALDAFGVRVEGRRCLDLGASTGGFTDCLLQRGARAVVAVDVGHGQMAPALAADPRVDLREGMNARYLTPSDVDGPFEIVVGDLSFISLTLVVEAIAGMAAPGGQVVLLVKPQFEVGPEGLGKGGIVRDAARRQAALERVIAAAEAAGLHAGGQMESPIARGDGNREFLVRLVRNAGTSPPPE